MTHLHPSEMAADTTFLAHDPDEGDWALWYKLIHRYRTLITWDGRIAGGGSIAPETWPWPDTWGRMLCIPVTPDQVAACEMFVMHTEDREEAALAWWRFCERITATEAVR